MCQEAAGRKQTGRAPFTFGITVYEGVLSFLTHYLLPHNLMNHAAAAEWISNTSAQNSESRGYQKTNKINRAAYEHSNGATCVSAFVFEQCCLELYNAKGQKIKACKTESKGRVVQGKHQSYKLSAASAEERDNWIDAIRWELLMQWRTHGRTGAFSQSRFSKV